MKKIPLYLASLACFMLASCDSSSSASTGPNTNTSGSKDSTGNGSSTAVAAPVFSPAGGTYSSAQSVRISSPTAGASIYYTLDGSVPSMTNPTTFLYSASVPLPISVSLTIKAIAVKGGASSSVTTAAFVINGTTGPGTDTTDPGIDTTGTAAQMNGTLTIAGVPFKMNVTGIYTDTTMMLTSSNSSSSSSTTYPQWSVIMNAKPGTGTWKGDDSSFTVMATYSPDAETDCLYSLKSGTLKVSGWSQSTNSAYKTATSTGSADFALTPWAIHAMLGDNCPEFSGTVSFTGAQLFYNGKYTTN